jgi:hypothetical protein
LRQDIRSMNKKCAKIKGQPCPSGSTPIGEKILVWRTPSPVFQNCKRWTLSSLSCTIPNWIDWAGCPSLLGSGSGTVGDEAFFFYLLFLFYPNFFFFC